MIEELLRDILGELQRISKTQTASVEVAIKALQSQSRGERTSPVQQTFQQVVDSIPPAVTRDMCRNALIARCTELAQGSAPGNALLAKFGATKIANLKEADFAAFYAAIPGLGK